MSPRKLKKKLQQDLRAKRNKERRPLLWLGLLLVAIGASGIYFYWSKHRPAALLQQGVRLEQQKKLAPALQKYRQVFEGYSERTLAADALFRSGQILQHDLGEDQKALLRYLQLEKNYPQSSHVVSAQREAAELTKNRLNDCGQAIPIYQRLIEQSAEDADRALYEIADCYIREKNWGQAAIEFETLLTSYPHSGLLQKARYRLADALLVSGRREEARTEFERLIKGDAKSQQAAEARFRLAEMLEEEERLKDALQAFAKLTDYPRQELLKQKILNLKERIARKKKVL